MNTVSEQIEKHERLVREALEKNSRTTWEQERQAYAELIDSLSGGRTEPSPRD